MPLNRPRCGKAMRYLRRVSADGQTVVDGELKTPLRTAPGAKGLRSWSANLTRELDLTRGVEDCGTRRGARAKDAESQRIWQHSGEQNLRLNKILSTPARYPAVSGSLIDPSANRSAEAAEINLTLRRDRTSRRPSRLDVAHRSGSSRNGPGSSPLHPPLERRRSSMMTFVHNPLLHGCDGIVGTIEQLA
jgi:hypothetical protein